MSGGVEDLVRRLDSSSDLLQLGQAAMARAAFHGAHTSVWAAVMAEPKVEQLVLLNFNLILSESNNYGNVYKRWQIHKLE